MRALACLAGVLVCAGWATARAEDATPNSEQPRGLYVHAGVLMKDGKPYRGIGANYFDLFGRTLKNPADTSSRENLRALAKAHIPFVRFMCGGFWPADQKLYLQDREAYFQRLDAIVKTAEESGIGLIPSLFWHLPTVSDLAGEHLDELGNPESKSIAYILRYTEEVVQRYRNSPAIWGWEFGNECNLGCDLPNATQHRPQVVPQLGTPKERTERDELKFSQLRIALAAFAGTARKLDPVRIIVSGNSVPRQSAYHNVTEKSWKPDTEEQFAEILLRDNPDPLNVICIHQYPEKNNAYAGGAKSIAELIGLATKHAARAGKPLFIGEFGAEKRPAEKERAVFEEFLAAIGKHQVPLAAFWVFDLDSQKKDWNVSFQNERAYMIELVAQANARIQARALDTTKP